VTEYYLEKMFGLIFNLPPRITSRYVDVKLPLDLSDDELFAQTPQELEDAKCRLTKDGWNTDGNLRAATWARLRYILSQFREGIVEYRFQASQAADPAQLRCVQSFGQRLNSTKVVSENCLLDVVRRGITCFPT
jgi:hypothetical protein